jgi:hypothetical protein
MTRTPHSDCGCVVSRNEELHNLVIPARHNVVRVIKSMRMRHAATHGGNGKACIISVRNRIGKSPLRSHDRTMLY